jgi:hypothetical protein
VSNPNGRDAAAASAQDIDGNAAASCAQGTDSSVAASWLCLKLYHLIYSSGSNCSFETTVSQKRKNSGFFESSLNNI